MAEATPRKRKGTGKTEVFEDGLQGLPERLSTAESNGARNVLRGAGVCNLQRRVHSPSCLYCFLLLLASFSLHRISYFLCC